MPSLAPRPFGAHLKALREAAGFTQEELAAIAGLSVHAVSALERGERRRPQFDTVRSLCSALDLTGTARDTLLASARAPADAPATDTADGASLPMPLTTLIGRDADMRVLRGWLDDPAVRLITLVGPGGVGKTRVALELARTLRDEGANRVVFVPLATRRDSAFVASAIAEALGLSDVSGVDLPRHAHAACEDQPTTIVLDNFEHVLPAAPLIADLLATAASIRVLVTSRAPLRIRGEREYSVGPLHLGAASEQLPYEELIRLPAVRLFVERVRDTRPDFSAAPENIQTLAAICRRLDALPLAIELAAPWMKLLTAPDLLRRLESDVLLTTTGPRDLPERQRTMNAAVAWSYQLLNADEQRAFRRLGALPGPFPIDAAAAVMGLDDTPSNADRALGTVAGLIDKSLLVRSETSVVPTCPLYSMLETVRGYASLQLTAAGERDEAMEGLVRYCAAEASQAAHELVGPAQVEWLDRVREDLESYRAALAWLIERGRPAEAVHMAWALLWFWVIRGHTTEGLRWFEAILNIPSLSPDVEARALLGASAMWYIQGALQRAGGGLARAKSLAQTAGNSDSIVHADFILGHVEHAMGNLEAAELCFADSLEGFRRAGVPWGVGHQLIALAWVASTRGDMVRAERLLDEATDALHDAGPWFLELGLYIRAVLAIRRGNADEAIAFVRESLLRIRGLRDRFAFVYALVPLAAAAVLKGDDEWAARIIGTRDAATNRSGVALLDHSVRDLRERTERGVRDRLGADRWQRAYAAGRTASIDSLLDDIRRTIG